jgi:hypothetical protein
MKSNTDSYYTKNNLNYRNDSYTPLYVLDLGEKKNKALERTTNDIFGSPDIMQDILTLEAEDISNKSSDNKEILV